MGSDPLQACPSMYQKLSKCPLWPEVGSEMWCSCWKASIGSFKGLQVSQSHKTRHVTYLQIALNEESKEFVAVNTHKELYRL